MEYKSNRLNLELIRLMKKDKLRSYTKLMKEFYKRTDIYSFQERMLLLKDYLEFNYSYMQEKKKKKKS